MGFIVGIVIGFFVGGCVATWAIDDARKESAKVGWIKIGDEIYTLRKADVVDAVEEVK